MVEVPGLHVEVAVVAVVEVLAVVVEVVEVETN